MNRHAADLARMFAIADQPPGGNGLPQAVVGHRMKRRAICRVALHLWRNALLRHKHGRAQRCRIRAQGGPVAGLDAKHWLTGFKAGQQAAQRIGHAFGGL